MSEAALPERDDCPVCGRTSRPYDCCDFNKNCEERHGHFVPLALRAVYYYRCAVCGFVYAPEFRSWSVREFQERIYNAEYPRFDPEFAESRPAANADMLANTFAGWRERLRFLDYGGGDGALAERLKAAGFDIGNHDPLYGHVQEEPEHGFHVVTAFEVFEHVPEPAEMLKDIVRFLRDDGLILFSTLISDGSIREGGRLTWWYAAPRNGHISLFTQQSLRILGDRLGLRTRSLGPGLHLYFRTLADWALPVFGIGGAGGDPRDRNPR